MGSSRRREWTVEEFDAWSETQKAQDEIARVADEEGGPRLSLIPDSRTSASGGGADWVGGGVAEPKDLTLAFEPEESRNRQSGWSAMRQQIFIEALAETGTVHLAASRAGLSARSAYQLRLRSPAFADAWNAAQQLAVGRLSALAFDRAIHGRLEQIYKDGELVGERRVPSERLLMWLLARLDPRRFARPWEKRGDEAADPQANAAAAFPDLLSALTDTPEFAERAERAERMPSSLQEENDAAEEAAEAADVPPGQPPVPAVTSGKIGKIGARVEERGPATARQPSPSAAISRLLPGRRSPEAALE